MALSVALWRPMSSKTQRHGHDICDIRIGGLPDIAVPDLADITFGSDDALG